MTRTKRAATYGALLACSLAWYVLTDVSFAVAMIAGGVSYAAARETAHKLHDAVSRDSDDTAFDGPVGARDARVAYVSGEIDEDELERRLDLAYDPDVRAIRREYESIGGVGEKTCHKLADHFGTLDAIDQATTDDLENVHGIGEKTAADIHDHDTTHERTTQIVA